MIFQCRPSSNFIRIFFFFALQVILSFGTAAELPFPALQKIKAEELQPMAERAIQQYFHEIQDVIATPKNQRTFENTLLRMDMAQGKLERILSLIYFVQDMSTLPESRQKAREVNDWMTAQLAPVSYNVDLYEALKQGVPQNPLQKKLYQKTMDAYRRLGIDQPVDVRDQLAQLNTKVEELFNQYSKNLSEDETLLVLKAEELSGIPSTELSKLPRNSEGQVAIRRQMMASYGVLMEYLSNSVVRKKVYDFFQASGGPANLALLDQILQMRQKVAQILGYPNFATMNLENRMAKKPEAVFQFLSEVQKAAQPIRQKEIQDLKRWRAWKDQVSEENQLEPWDIAFYKRRFLEERLAYDPLKVKEYLPAEEVISGAIKIFADFHRLRIQEIRDGELWDPLVRVYSVSTRSGGKVLAHLYLDLFQRPGKSPGAYAASASPYISTGRRVLPYTLIKGNFAQPPPAGQPHLLTLNEVTTLFHELGHAMHGMLTKVPYPSMAGTSVKRDFVELPSQLMENWVFDRKVFHQISGHYTDFSKKLPDEIFEKIEKNNLAFQGMMKSRQVLLARLDMALHSSSAPVDILQTYRDLHQQIMLEPAAESSLMPANFSHLHGYAAGYYSYMWADRIVFDAFSRFEKEGLMNPSTAYDFRTKILERGDLEDPAVMMKNFLGYESEGKAFFDHIHRSGEIDWFPPAKSMGKSTGGVDSVAARGSILGCDQIFH